MGKSKLRIRSTDRKPAKKVKIPKRTRVKDEDRTKAIQEMKQSFIYHCQQEGISTAKAIKLAGIESQSSIFEWMKDDPIFKEQYYKMREDKDPSKIDPVVMAIGKKEREKLREEGKKELILGAEVEKDTKEVKIAKSAVIEAYRYSNFNLTEACDQTGIPRITAISWLETDPEFKESFRQVDEEKKDLVESQLLAKVAQGDIAATIFASKCLLKDRGYNENPTTIRARIEVVHSKEERDAIIEAARIIPAQLANTPGGKFLVEKLEENEVVEGEIIDG